MSAATSRTRPRAPCGLSRASHESSLLCCLAVARGDACRERSSRRALQRDAEKPCPSQSSTAAASDLTALAAASQDLLTRLLAQPAILCCTTAATGLLLRPVTPLARRIADRELVRIGGIGGLGGLGAGGVQPALFARALVRIGGSGGVGAGGVLLAIADGYAGEHAPLYENGNDLSPSFKSGWLRCLQPAPPITGFVSTFKEEP
mmetsp:Transcript_46582/g.85409  ORF Transcript_46582/g.85409 Transcript_46582/m.85409 type:complete len:205 (+) Transcript_46582:904-1518(+)